MVMLLTREVETVVNYKNLKRYLERGYEFDTFINRDKRLSVKRNTKITVKVEDLDPKSGSVVRYKCDYCGNEKEVKYCDYMRHYPDGNKTDKDACKKCGHLKVQEKLTEKYGVNTPFALEEIRKKRDETVKKKYGVDNVFQLQEVKDKSKETTLEKYGVEWYTQTDEYKERYSETCIEKYGVDNVSKAPEVIDKIKQTQIDKYGMFYSQTNEFKERYKNTCLEKYGVENLFQANFVKEKIIKYNIENYGVKHPMKIESIKNARLEKMTVTKYRNGTGQSSRQQDYLHLLYGGELNYPLDRSMLDIAFLDDMVCCEYDGSGHALSVNFGDHTQEEFENKEMRRKYYLFSKGWREFRIISNNDYLPFDDVLLEMKELSFKWFNKGHKWIKFYIDDGKYETSEGFKEFDYGKLRKVKEEDLNKETA